MPKFDTSVQELKYKVLKEVARLAKEDRLQENLLSIPETIIPGPEPTTRCCIYKERAIVGQRIQMALGGHPEKKNEVEVLTIACDECPVSRMTVGDACRGCIARRCEHVCPKDAISHPHHTAVIDPKKCIACGKCASACPYGAITKNVRPCERACKPGAIHMDENHKAEIDEEKCVSCGACVYQCPFGAIVDKSYILSIVHLLKEAASEGAGPLYAVIAPSIAGQFGNVKTGQIVNALKALGFSDVIEAALGADIVAYREAKELKGKGFLTSSCCPAFVSYIRKFYPKMAEHISSNLSPMAAIGQLIKKAHPNASIVFIGPCVAKKGEIKQERVRDIIDAAMTFEELQALFDAYEIDPAAMEEGVLDNASYFGRIFARSGGLRDAVAEALKEQKVTDEEFHLNPVVCSGLEECKTALLKAQLGKLPENFIEGMACEQGCIGGPGCLTHGAKEASNVDKYGRLALEKSIEDSLYICELLGMPAE